MRKLVDRHLCPIIQVGAPAPRPVQEDNHEQRNPSALLPCPPRRAQRWRRAVLVAHEGRRLRGGGQQRATGALRAFVTRAVKAARPGLRHVLRRRSASPCGRSLRSPTSSDTAAALAARSPRISCVQNPYDPQPKGPGVVGAFKDSYHKGRDKARLRAVRPTTPSAGTRRRIPLV